MPSTAFDSAYESAIALAKAFAKVTDKALFDIIYGNPSFERFTCHTDDVQIGDLVGYKLRTLEVIAVDNAGMVTGRHIGNFDDVITVNRRVLWCEPPLIREIRRANED